MYDFTEVNLISSEAASASAWDDGDLDDSIGGVEEHKMESERAWGLMSDQFTNAGYREGITAGKEGALQGGFDAGFARVGAPLGREIGNLRGIVTALSHLLKTSSTSRGPGKLRWSAIEKLETEERSRLTDDVGSLARRLNALGLRDLAPPDEEALTHAKEHVLSVLDEASINEAAPSASDEKSKKDHNSNVVAVDEEARDARLKHAKGVLELEDIQKTLSVIVHKLGLEDVLSKSASEDVLDRSPKRL